MVHVEKDTECVTYYTQSISWANAIHTLNLPPDQRLEGTAAAVALAIDRGADIVRVHDVAAMTRVARFTDAVVRR